MVEYINIKKHLDGIEEYLIQKKNKQLLEDGIDIVENICLAIFNSIINDGILLNRGWTDNKRIRFSSQVILNLFCEIEIIDLEKLPFLCEKYGIYNDDFSLEEVQKIQPDISKAVKDFLNEK